MDQPVFRERERKPGELAALLPSLVLPNRHLHLAQLCGWLPCLPQQGAFKRVAGEVEACARELAGILRRRLLAAPDQAAECIQMIAKLGEPTESLQARTAACRALFTFISLGLA